MGVSFTDKELMEGYWWDLVRKLSAARNKLFGETPGQRAWTRTRIDSVRYKAALKRNREWKRRAYHDPNSDYRERRLAEGKRRWDWIKKEKQAAERRQKDYQKSKSQ